MPQLGESLTEGTIVKYVKKRRLYQENKTLLEISCRQSGLEIHLRFGNCN